MWGKEELFPVTLFWSNLLVLKRLCLLYISFDGDAGSQDQRKQIASLSKGHSSEVRPIKCSIDNSNISFYSLLKSTSQSEYIPWHR